MAVSERSERWNKDSKEEYSRLLRQFFTHKFDQQNVTYYGITQQTSWRIVNIIVGAQILGYYRIKEIH